MTLKNHYVRRFTDPYGNVRGDQGQLLLSYPSVESYLLSCVHEDVFQKRYFLGKDIKNDTASEGISTDIIQSDSQLTHAAEEMDEGLNAIGIRTYDLDALGSTLIDVFEKQEEIRKTDDGGFSALSLLSMALLELGILIEDDAALFP